ncbi:MULTISPECIES: ABC transporter substrate-binding protein [unclassified Sulfitobacter]|uniref:ABC transporter substrate-binding protein n=1 Tax=unclassified Sulfitobacter TaxID=196795 RepID=UPI0007C2D6F3|nr:MULTISPECIES: ABC transporter substrate-binding protein [unclassified Sulfitobacter]KZY02679.1 branched-chain amino acid ABC transporter substrate-binding protein [Sulfitobacter sp. HI0023]KZY24271.1 branched-chain amino acid ABC transporter substrate-binding protein [Sulfitobacter sp. HI0040]KZZ63936.1 branched-chain amino acid ABC transporter substrate-binding protein [Sulfitobacter sp. HI0129]
MLLAAGAQAETVMKIGYLKVDTPRPPVLSNLDPVPEDLGLAGARTGLEDNATTGRFLGQTYTLIEDRVPEGGDAIAAAKAMLAQTPFVLLDAPGRTQLAIADLKEAQGALLFNASSGETALRSENCRANLLHSLPSDAMRTDALAQVLMQKRWTDLVLIAGTHPEDLAYVEALRRSLTKFGLKLSDEKTWAFDADMRRNAAQEVPLFTQDFGDYDALIVADELGDFGRYILYNTWQARPVVGSEGLSAVAWSPVMEQWGAAQLQSRFTKAAGRAMMPRDYAAWAAVRTLGEAVTRLDSSDPASLRGYILSETFELAGFKGRPMTYRSWNGQLRQPIAVVHPRAMVAQAPLEGFLHRVNELDTLGLDEPESKCEAFE